ncbi:MAG TPA: DinB family protein [Blastocatellia bacterium]|nr:DinB family protein [Blastocatellia bacterium]
MIYHSIAEVFETIERTHSSFIASVTNLSPGQEDFRPVPDRWTIAEISEHVGIVNSGFLRLAQTLLKQAEAEPKPPRTNLEFSLQRLTDSGTMKEKWKAPERVEPHGGVPVAESTLKNQQAIDQLSALKPRFEAVDLSGPTWDHPFLGPLNLYETLIVLVIHETKHRHQVEEIKASAGFPA